MSSARQEILELCLLVQSGSESQASQVMVQKAIFPFVRNNLVTHQEETTIKPNPRHGANAGEGVNWHHHIRKPMGF
jgi:hypothetical protein